MPSKKFRIVHRIPSSNILVDYWKSQTQDKYYRFMTYLRIGADDSIKDICESTYTIYTSLFNKWYLITYYQVSEHRIVELRENETITVLDDQSKPAFSVTAFDANYYTGSLMFLFQGSFGNVLYTGFFRPSSFDSIFEAPILKAVVDKRELDVAFIDNTYAAEHCEFPSRSEIMDQIVTCLRQHPKHKIAISGKRLGKEEILLDIAKALDEKIHVSEEKFIILSRLNLQSHFTTDKKKSRIYACDYIINPKECMKMQAEEGPYIIILLTAFYHCNRMSSNEEFSVPGLYIFPYSGHCSHSELVRFISFLKPRDVQPIIKFMTDEHSIIPQSIYKLCYNPLALTENQTNSVCSCKSVDSQKFYTCDAGNSQNFCSCKSQASARGTSSSSATDMITVYDSAQKQELIDNAINELKSFNDVDDFLESVSELSSVSNFGQDVSESIMSVSTIEISGNLHESSFHNLMSNSRDSSDTIFYASTTGESRTQRSDVIPPTNSSSPVSPADTQNVEQTNKSLVPDTRLNFRVSKSISALQNTKAFYKCFDNMISTSSTVLTSDVTKTPEQIPNLSQDQVHSTNTYVENDVAENVISSTNNDSLPEITSPPVQEPIEKQGASISVVTVGDVNIDIRSDLDLQDMTDKDEHAVTPIINEVRIEEQPQKRPEVIKTYEEKSVQTDLTLQSLLRLEKSCVPQKSLSEAELSVAENQTVPDATEDVTRLIAKYVSTNKRAVFDVNHYFGKRCNKRGSEMCTLPTCRECRSLEENAKKRKLIKNTLYNSAMAMKPPCIVSPNNVEFYRHLKGYNMAHPIYRNQLNF